MLTGTFATLAAMAGLLALSGFFSGSETALFSLRAEHLRALSRHRGRFIRRLLHDPRSLLITILFGNLVVNILFYSTSVLLALGLEERGHMGLATAVGVAAPFMVIIFGEVGPKALAVHHPRPIAELAAPALTLLRAAILPIRVVLGVFTEGVLRLVVPPRAAEPYVTPEELKQLLEASQVRGTLRPDEGRMLRELIDLGRLRCREVMVPRVDVVMCPIEETPERFIDLVRATRRKRIPVYHQNKDQVLGLVDARHVLALKPSSLSECVRRIPFVPETKSVESLLTEFRHTHTAMAVVLDEYGGTAGLVTLHDILEEIVGEIGAQGREAALREPAGTAFAEGGSEPPEGLVEEVAPGTYRLPGRLSIRDWNEHPAFSLELDRRGTATIGGFVTSLLGHVPTAGESVTYRNLHFTVERMGRRRIDTLSVEILG